MNLKKTLWCLPSVVGALIVLAIAIFASRKTVQIGEVSYACAKTAIQEGNHDRALVCMERALQAEPSNQERQFWMAILAFRRGEMAYAFQLLNTLSERDRLGYPPAHLVTAQILLSGTPTAEKVDLAETHLKRVFELRPNMPMPMASLLLGKIQAGRGNFQQATEHYQTAAKAHPELEVYLALLYQQMGKQANAKAISNSVIQYCQKQLIDQPKDVSLRVALARAQALLGDYRTALDGLKKIGMGSSEFWDVRETISSLYAEWADARSTEDGSSTPGEVVELILEANKYSPRSPRLLDKLANRLEVDFDGKQIEAMRALAAKGKADASALMVLGTAVWRKGQHEEAKAHWEHATRLEPGMIGAMNNLAIYWYKKDNSHLQKALDMVQTALLFNPAEPHLLQTRGVVLTRLNRLQDALLDLQMALKSLPNDPEMHDALAEHYEKRSAPEMANQHRLMAQSIRAVRNVAAH